MNKFRAKKTTVDDIIFDSLMEARFYDYLKILKEEKKIKDFELQPEFILIPKFENCHKKYRAMTYKADYKIIYNNDIIEYIDVKGILTDRTNVKIKLLRYQQPDIKLTLLRNKKKDIWIDLETKKEWQHWVDKKKETKKSI